MKCSDVMKRDVECCEPNESVATIARKMRDNDIGFVPVCDASGKVVGTITDRDLTLRVIAEGLPIDRTQAHQVMTKGVLSVKPDDTLETAERMMSKHQKSRMLCCDANGKIAGVISLADIARKDTSGEALNVMRSVKSPNGRGAQPHSP